MDHSNTDSDSEEGRKSKAIKERSEFSNQFEVKDETKTKKLSLLAYSRVDENLDIDMDEPKDNLVSKLRIKMPVKDEKKEGIEAETAECEPATIEETHISHPTSSSGKNLTQGTQAHQVLRRVRTKSENDQLIDWIEKHENEKIKASLKDRSLRHSVDDSGRTLLHISAACGNAIVTNYAMNICDMNARDSNGRTALMLAVEKNHVHVVEMLLSLTDIDILDNEGKDLLHLGFAKKDLSKDIAALLLWKLHRRYGNSEEIAEKLVDSGCQMYQAVRAGDVALVKSMLARGVDVNAADPNKNTALHTSVVLEEPEIVKVLLEAGASAQALNIDGISPLFCNYACPRAPGDRRKLAILDLLLARKVPLTTTIESGMFQVSPSLMFGCAEAIARLLRAGYLDFGAVDARDGSRPMHYLASNCNRGVARQLKLYASEYDYHVNATDKLGMVALYRAIVVGSVEMLQFLLDHGTNANSTMVETNTPQNSTPMYLCTDKRVPFARGYLLETLLQHKADPQAPMIDHSGKSSTLFDWGRKSRLKPVIAHLAMIERQGELITELISEKINSSAKFQRYFDRCQVVLDMILFGSITVLKLLSDSEEKVMGYLSNGELRLKLKKLSQKLDIQDSFSYYFNTLRKRVVKLLRLKELRNKAARIVCKWFENPLDEKHIVIERILDFLDVSSLEKLTY